MQIAGRLGQGRQIGRLRQSQLIHRAPVVVQRRSGDAVVAQAQIDFVEIEFEDALFRIGRLDAEAQQHLADLALEAALIGEQEVLGHLLGDGRGALHALAALHQNHKSAGDALGINAAMGVEILVFRRKEGLLHHGGNGGAGQIEAPLARIFRQDGAVARMHAGHHGGLVILQLGGVGQILLVMP